MAAGRLHDGRPETVQDHFDIKGRQTRMESIFKAMENLNLNMKEREQSDPIPFEAFLKILSQTRKI